MIQVYVIRASNLSMRSNYATVSVNIYANGYLKTKVGKTKKSKLQNPIFDVDKKNPFYIPFVIANSLEFEVVGKSSFHHKTIIGSAQIPLNVVGEECTFEVPVTSTSHINNDAKLTLVIIPNMKPFDFVSHFPMQSNQQLSNPSSSWKSPFYIYVTSSNSSNFEIEKNIISHTQISILRFHQLGRYPSLITRDSSAVFPGVLLPYRDHDYHINGNTKNTQIPDVFEFNPEILSPFYYTPIISCSGFRGTLVINVVSNFSTPSKSPQNNFDFKILKQTTIEVENDGCYSSGLIFWPKPIGRVSFITRQSFFHGNININSDADQILSQISPPLKTSLKNGPLTQDVRRRFYQSEEESYSLSLENISDFTASLFPPIFNCTIDNVKARSKIFMSYYLFDKNYKHIAINNSYESIFSSKSENSLTVRLYEIPNEVNYVFLCAHSNSKSNNQAKLTIKDADNNKEIANSLTFLMQSNYLKILFILYRVTDDRWSSIEGQDWVSNKDSVKIPSKIAKIASVKLGLADKNVKHFKKLISKYHEV